MVFIMNPAQLDFTSLRIFIAVARTGSISAGAAQVHLSPSAVSKRVAELEEHAGAPLLFRGQSGVALTPAGTTLLDHALRLEQSVHHLASAMEDYARGVAGHVRVLANPSALYQGLPARIANFRRAYPSVKVEVEERLSAEVARAVRERRAEIGVFAANVKCEDLVLVPFGVDRLVLAVPTDHPLATRNSMYLREALDYDFVSQFDSFALNSVLTITATEEGRAPKINSLMRGYGSICCMVSAGLGVSVLPESAVMSELKAGKLKIVYLEDGWASRPLVVAISDESGMSAAVRALRGFLTE